MVANSVRLAEEGWIEPPLLFSFVLGQVGAMPAIPKSLLFLSRAIAFGWPKLPALVSRASCATKNR
jgi:3-keto-5-aminohexanoate cleavage enzyme